MEVALPSILQQNYLIICQRETLIEILHQGCWKSICWLTAIIGAGLVAMHSKLLPTKDVDLPGGPRGMGFFSFLHNTSDLATHRIARFHPLCQVLISAGEKLEEQKKSF